MTEKVTLNLTWPILIWMGVWSVLAIIFTPALFGVALIPVILIIAFYIFALGAVALAFCVAWASDTPIEVKNKQGQVIRTIQRKRKK